MLNKKTVYIGDKILEPGKHFVLVDGFLEEKSLISREFDVQGGGQYQLFVPSGYTIYKYRTPDQTRMWGGRFYIYVDNETCEGSVLYVNNVPVEVKVYEENGMRFCPEFGTPVKSKRR